MTNEYLGTYSIEWVEKTKQRVADLERENAKLKELARLHLSLYHPAVTALAKEGIEITL